MKRRIYALLLCICLLIGGCASSPEKIELPPETEKVSQSETPAPKETTEKTTPAPQTTAAESEAPPAPTPEEAKVAVPPTLLTETIELTPLVEPITREEIEALFGYDVEFTGADAEIHQKQIEAVEKAASEGYLSSERLEKYREQNYLDMIVDACRLGLPEADWFCTADYMPDYYCQGSILTRAAFIKDGKIVKEIDPIGCWSFGNYYSEGELYLAMCTGLYRYDFETGETVTVMEDSWAGVNYLDRNYLIYGNGDQKILIRETGEIVDPGIRWCGLQTQNTFRFLDGEIRYVENVTSRPCVYDMNERTVTEDSSTDFDTAYYQGMPDDEYELSFFKMSGDSEKYEGLKAIHKESGEETFYDLSGLRELYYLWRWAYPLDGEWLWLDGNKALNLRTGALARLPEGEKIYYSMNSYLLRDYYDSFSLVKPIYPDDPKTE